MYIYWWVCILEQLLEPGILVIFGGKFRTPNILRPRQNGHDFADDTFKRIFVNDTVRILIGISLKFVPKGPIENIPLLVQIMVWRRPGDKPSSEPMMLCLPTHICVTRPQWVNPHDDICQSLPVVFPPHRHCYVVCTVMILFCHDVRKRDLSICQNLCTMCPT